MKKWLLTLFLFGLVGPLLAQNTPSRAQTQPVVLADLARRVGQPALTLSDLGDWAWFFGTYSYVTGLGCIGAPADLGGRWQRWEMTYGATPYVYLVTDDAQTLILCNEAALTTPTIPAPATATALPALTVIPPTSGTLLATATGQAASGSLGVPADSGGGCPLTPRLSIGGAGRVTPGDPNWLHEQANRTSRKVGELAAGTTFIVSQGPVCDAASGMNYWLVQENVGQSRLWTSEGRNGEYWLEPIVVKAVIDSTNAALLAPADWVTAFPVAIQNVMFSATGRYFVVLDTTGRAALYDATTQNLINELRAPGTNPQPFTQIHFSDDDTYLTTVDAANNIYIWQVASVRPVGQITLETPVTALTFGSQQTASPILAVATDDGQVRLWPIPVVTPQTPPLVTLTVEGQAAELILSRDGQMLMARDAEGKMLALWNIGE